MLYISRSNKCTKLIKKDLSCVFPGFSHFRCPKPVFPRTVFTGKYHGKNRVLSKTLQPWTLALSHQHTVCDWDKYVQILTGNADSYPSNKGIKKTYFTGKLTFIENPHYGQVCAREYNQTTTKRDVQPTYVLFLFYLIHLTIANRSYTLDTWSVIKFCHVVSGM